MYSVLPASGMSGTFLTIRYDTNHDTNYHYQFRSIVAAYRSAPTDRDPGTQPDGERTDGRSEELSAFPVPTFPRQAIGSNPEGV